MTEATELVDRAEVRDGRAIVTYSRTEAALEVLREKYAGATYDLTTTAGDKAARAARLELKTLRTSLEEKRKELKAPALEFGKKIDAEAARLAAEIQALESPIDAQIKADEKRRDDERRAREEAEAARKKVHTDGIAKIAGYVGLAADLPADRIAKGIEHLEQMSLSRFEEFTDEATATRSRTVAALRALHAKALAREEEAARLKAEREEQARVAAEQAETARKLREQQEELERQRAAIEAEARRQAEAREAEERRQREAAAEAERHAAIARRREEANAAGSAAMQAIGEARQADDLPAPLLDAMEQAASGLIADLALTHAAESSKPAAPAVIPMPTRAPAAPPSLKLGEINRRIAPLQIDAAGLASLGFPHAATAGAAKLYREEDYPSMVDAMVAHLVRSKMKEAA